MNPWPYPLWIAHRGAGKLAPENTLAAFRVGARHGYRAFECDVKLSADGIPFLLHDDTLQRTTSGSGIAGTLAWGELARLDAGSWHSQAYVGEPMPSLDTIARYVIHHHFALNIEIKPTPGTEQETGEVVAREAARLWSRESVKPLLSSFSSTALAAARVAEESLPRALLLDGLRDGWLDEARALACVAIVANHASFDSKAIAQVHAAGMQALSYTVNDRAIARRLIAAGIAGLITDAVNLFSPNASFSD